MAPSGDIYFRDELFSPNANETFIDCGAFDGDTLQLFLQKSGNAFQKYVAFEPDPENYQKLAETVAGLPDAVRGDPAVSLAGRDYHFDRQGINHSAGGANRPCEATISTLGFAANLMVHPREHSSRACP